MVPHLIDEPSNLTIRNLRTWKLEMDTLGFTRVYFSAIESVRLVRGDFLLLYSTNAHSLHTL